jgi:hypothetical protein
LSSPDTQKEEGISRIEINRCKDLNRRECYLHLVHGTGLVLEMTEHGHRRSALRWIYEDLAAMLRKIKV